MAWANLDDQFPKHPKVLKLTDGAFRLHVSAICYSAQYLTDGIIDTDTVPLLMPRYRKTLLDELLRKGQWKKHPAGYEIHDYLEWNRSKEEITEERDKRRRVRSEAGKKGAAARWQNR